MNQKTITSSSAEFSHSFVKDPVQIHTHSITNAHKNNQISTLSTKFYGDYEDYKITQFLLPNDESKPQNRLNVLDGKLIDLVTVKGQEGKVEIGKDFFNLMNQYVENDVVFVTVMGERSAGKSFFCDKILNLGQVNGNHFCRVAQKGIKLWSAPFIKENMCIFLIQMVGCQLNPSNLKLITLMLLLSSAIVFVNQVDKNSASSKLLNLVKESVKLIDFTEGQVSNTEINELLPEFLLNLVRKQELRREEYDLMDCEYFKQIYTKYLPDAMNKKYKGEKKDLLEVPFLTKECINQQYIREVYSIFKFIYEEVNEKQYRNVYTNGKIVVNLIREIGSCLNEGKKVKIEKIYDKLTEDLYNSAFNYCVIQYNTELEVYFEDENPKTFQEMIHMFQSASSLALEKFNEFTIHPKFHSIFENKLISYMDQKQSTLLEINKSKTVSKLRSILSAFNFQDSHQYKANFRMMNQLNKELNHGRDIVVGEKLVDLEASFILEAILYSSIISQSNEEKKETLMELVEEKQRRLQQLQKNNENIKEMRMESSLILERESMERKIQNMEDKLENYKNEEGQKLQSQINNLLKRKNQLKSKLFLKSEALKEYKVEETENEFSDIYREKEKELSKKKEEVRKLQDQYLQLTHKVQKNK